MAIVSQPARMNLGILSVFLNWRDEAKKAAHEWRLCVHILSLAAQPRQFRFQAFDFGLCRLPRFGFGAGLFLGLRRS